MFTLYRSILLASVVALVACSQEPTTACEGASSDPACQTKAIGKTDLPPMKGAKPINYDNPTITQATLAPQASQAQ